MEIRTAYLSNVCPYWNESNIIIGSCFQKFANDTVGADRLNVDLAFKPILENRIYI